MTRFYAYTRVSTLKQGEKGVSLQEQHAAIARFAERQSLQITKWFEERLTAAKNGRPLFAKMLKGLRSGDAHGVIIHKIDRSARNLRDWADLGELIDAGIVVHFANESIDLQSRGGRLSADIQAVVAADFIRNLREETLKGMRGRLKQGLLPFGAPLGYVNTGKGNVKTVDPLAGPIMQQAFELYSTGRYTLDSLVPELLKRGLRNRAGKPVGRTALSLLLNNPFYTGLIRIRTTGETYRGNHTPLISMALFQQVQRRLTRRVWTSGWTHEFALRGLFRCSLCHRQLIGELQKGHVYYRCHARGCPTRTFREDVLEAAMLASWGRTQLTDGQKARLLETLEHLAQRQHQGAQEHTVQVQVQIGALKSRMSRLVDALVDGALDKMSFEERKRTLLEEQQLLEASVQRRPPEPAEIKQVLLEQFELASNAQQSYRLASVDSKRELALRLCSNRTVAENDVRVEPSFVFQLFARHAAVPECDHSQDRVRTDEAVVNQLIDWATVEISRVNGIGDGDATPV